jgi:hypothetical protein
MVISGNSAGLADASSAGIAPDRSMHWVVPARGGKDALILSTRIPGLMPEFRAWLARHNTSQSARDHPPSTDGIRRGPVLTRA